MASVSQATITLLERFSQLNSNLGTPAIQIAFGYLSEIKVILFLNRQGGSKGRAKGRCQISPWAVWLCILGKIWLMNWHNDHDMALDFYASSQQCSSHKNKRNAKPFKTHILKYFSIILYIYEYIHDSISNSLTLKNLI